MKCAVIGDDVTVSGFMLGGFFEGHVVFDYKSAKEAFESMLSCEDIGLIAIENSIAQELSEFILSARKNYKNLMILEIPSRHSKNDSTSSIDQIVLEVMG